MAKITKASASAWAVLKRTWNVSIGWILKFRFSWTLEPLSHDAKGRSHPGSVSGSGSGYPGLTKSCCRFPNNEPSTQTATGRFWNFPFKRDASFLLRSGSHQNVFLQPSTEFDLSSNQRWSWPSKWNPSLIVVQLPRTLNYEQTYFIY